MGLDQGPTNPRESRGFGPTPLGVANCGPGRPELFGEKPTQARGALSALELAPNIHRLRWGDPRGIW